MGLGLKDENGKPVIYNYGYFDIIKKAIHMKAQWMVATIKAQFLIKGSSSFLMSLTWSLLVLPMFQSQREAIGIFNDVLGGIPALRGIHCCGIPTGQFFSMQMWIS